MMEISDFRRARLQELVTKAGGPAEFARQHSRADADKPIDQTYVSQLLNKHRNFGEKAARSMEKRAGLRPYYFDGSEILNPLEAQLVAMYRKLPESFQDALLQDANKYLGLANPEASAANPFNGAKVATKV